MHTGLCKLDYTHFLKLFYSLYNAYNIYSVKKVSNIDSKMPYERKKVETFTIEARNRISISEYKFMLVWES